MNRFLPAVFAASFAFGFPVIAADPPKPLKVLLIAGGGYHDYKKQKGILKEGLEARANLTVEVMFVDADQKSTKPELPLYGNPDYGKGFDLIIHDECAAEITDPAIVEGVVKPHRDGIPGVNLHCAMHSYGKGNAGKPLEPGSAVEKWVQYTGLQTSAHGSQMPIALTVTDKSHPVTASYADWTTLKEELYNNIRFLETAHPLISGVQTYTKKTKQADGTETEEPRETKSVVAWTNTYGSTRVFSTTLGHNTETVAEPRYLDLVTNGVLWATDKLGTDGKVKAGYGPGGK